MIGHLRLRGRGAMQADSSPAASNSSTDGKKRPRSAGPAPPADLLPIISRRNMSGVASQALKQQMRAARTEATVRARQLHSQLQRGRQDSPPAPRAASPAARRYLICKSAAGSFGLGFAERAGGVIISEVAAHSSAESVGLEAGVRLVRLECGHGATYDVDTMPLADVVHVLREQETVTLCVAPATEEDLEPRARPVAARCQEQASEESRRGSTSPEQRASCETYVVLPGLLNDADIASVERATEEQPDQPQTLYGEAHSAQFLHRAGYFERREPALFGKLMAAMRLPPDWPSASETANNVLQSAGGGCPPSGLSVRCIEAHTYTCGGGLLEQGHIDQGSSLSLSVVLTEPTEGGHFVTTGADGTAVTHALSRGDGVLFRSDTIHNVTTVTAGVRRALVIELWNGAPNERDRDR